MLSCSCSIMFALQTLNVRFIYITYHKITEAVSISLTECVVKFDGIFHKIKDYTRLNYHR